METVAEIVLHGVKQVAPGSEAFGRLKLPSASLLLPGDHFIIRQFSPVVTIGGGVVLDALPIPRMLDRDNFLQTLSRGTPEAILRARIVRRGHSGMSTSKLVAETGWSREFIETNLSSAAQQRLVLRAGELFVDETAMSRLQQSIVSAVTNFHKKNSLVVGIAKEELREQLKTSASAFAVAMNRLMVEKRIEVTADLVRIPGHGVVMKDDEAESKKTIEEAFANAGLKVPALHEVIAGLKVDKVRAQKIVTLLLRDRTLLKISDELVFHRGALDDLRRRVAAQKAKSPKIDVAMFKELTGVSRKYAIPLLEYLDRERVTKRVGDAREIL
jgi:selenocysteine-specific elongation factor